MKLKNGKLSLITIAAFGIILVFFGVLPVFSSPGFSVYEFSRGMLAGMCGVAAVIWLIDLFTSVFKAYKSAGLTSVMKNNMKVLLSSSISLFLIGIIFSAGIPGNTSLNFIGFIILCISIVLNLIYLGKVRRQKYCDDAVNN